LKVTYDLFLNFVHPDDRNYLIDAITECLKGSPLDVEYRIVLTDGEERIVHTEAESIYHEGNIPVQAKGIIQDITERKKAEKELDKLNRIRIKEIHHRIKNNLQVISSLLDLQAEKLQNKEFIENTEVLEAFEESQNRILSMSLIHEELYKGEGTDKLNFSAYVQRLVRNLFQAYKVYSRNVRLDMDLEENSFFDMDTAIPLGIIVNELVSNSLKHAFDEDQEGVIRIRLYREAQEEETDDTHEFRFNLTISDNGRGLPENMELESLESLGLQLVNILVDQLDGTIEVKRAYGTEFRITFKIIETGNK
jgi:two-component sensor histidine kinase